MSTETKSSSSLGQLTEIQRHVTQQHGTEPPYSGKLLHNKREGIYHCLVCSASLFYSENKYDSGCGWPSFYQPVHHDAIKYLADNTRKMKRMEISCSRCSAHLGHVFPDGPQPTGERYCVNSASMSFIDAKNGDKTTG